MKDDRFKDNLILQKSFDFALRIVKLSRYLADKKKEYVLSKEILVAGTHIGKHVKQAVDAEHRDIFISEMGVARRKASETEYWLLLMLYGDLISEPEFDSIESDRREIFALLTSIVKTSKKNV